MREAEAGDGRGARLASAAWTAAMLAAIALLGLIGFVLAIGAEKATPQPSGLHLTLNRIVVAAGLLALCAASARGVADRSRRKAAMLILAAVALLFGLLTMMLIAQQA